MENFKRSKFSKNYRGLKAKDLTVYYIFYKKNIKDLIYYISNVSLLFIKKT